MQKRDLAPLSGVLFVLLAIVGLAVLGGSTPDGDASARKVVSFYTDHDSQQGAAAIVLGLSAVPLLFFAATMRAKTRLALSERSVLPGFALGAGVVAAGGMLGAVAVHLALTDYAGDVQPAAAQAVNAIDGYFIVPFAAGLVTLVLACSLAALRSELLPTWLGWVGVVLFVLGFTPAAFFAVVLSGPWIVVVSVLLYRSEAGARSRVPLGETSGAASPAA